MPDTSDPLTAMFRWTTDDAVGIEQFDREHRQLITLVENLHRAMLSGAGRRFLDEHLSSVVECVDTHFSHEEHLMECVGYPRLAEHRKEHQGIRIKLGLLQERLVSGETTLTIQTMLLFEESLRHQIGEGDRQMAAYLKAKGINSI